MHTYRIFSGGTVYVFVDSFPLHLRNLLMVLGYKCGSRVFPAGGVELDSPSKDDICCLHYSAGRSKRGGGLDG